MHAPASKALLTHPEGIIWDAHGPTALGVEVYTKGDCWALAWEVAQLTKGSIQVLKPFAFHENFWIHALVQVAEDLYLDVEGLHTRAEVEARWHAKLHPHEWSSESFASYRDAMGASWQYGNARRQTRELAKRLVSAVVG